MIVGVDLGGQGGAVALNARGQWERHFDFEKATLADFRDWLYTLPSGSVIVCEQLAARGETAGPGQVRGSQANWAMGRSFGRLEGLTTSLGLPLQTVPPSVWKRYHRLLRQDKGASRACAEALWPGEGLFKRAKDHNRAEAALIAEWYRRTASGFGSQGP